MLMEKMVNVKAVLDSSHSLPTHSTSPGFVQFVPVEFLAKTQKVFAISEELLLSNLLNVRLFILSGIQKLGGSRQGIFVKL